MSKITVASFAGTLVTASALWAGLATGPAAAVAGDLCYSVSQSGVGGAHEVSRCVNYNLGTICEYQTGHVGQLETVSVEVCVPAP
jgi:hypothetical protein